MSQWFLSQAADFYDIGYKSWSLDTASVSIPEVNILKKKNSSTFAVSVPINHSIKFGFVSVNGTRETYFIVRLRIKLKLVSSIHHRESEDPNVSKPEIITKGGVDWLDEIVPTTPVAEELGDGP